jgi:hypothetical protein
MDDCPRESSIECVRMDGWTDGRMDGWTDGRGGGARALCGPVQSTPPAMGAWGGARRAASRWVPSGGQGCNNKPLGGQRGPFICRGAGAQARTRQQCLPRRTVVQKVVWGFGWLVGWWSGWPAECRLHTQSARRQKQAVPLFIDLHRRNSPRAPRAPADVKTNPLCISLLLSSPGPTRKEGKGQGLPHPPREALDHLGVGGPMGWKQTWPHPYLFPSKPARQPASQTHKHSPHSSRWVQKPPLPIPQSLCL